MAKRSRDSADTLHCRLKWLFVDDVQEIRDTGVAGYQYIEVEDDLAASVLYGNSTVVHLGSDQIPADAMVTEAHLSHLSVLQPVYSTLYRHLSASLYFFHDKS